MWFRPRQATLVPGGPPRKRRVGVFCGFLLLFTANPCIPRGCGRERASLRAQAGLGLLARLLFLRKPRPNGSMLRPAAVQMNWPRAKFPNSGPHLGVVPSTIWRVPSPAMGRDQVLWSRAVLGFLSERAAGGGVEDGTGIWTSISVYPANRGRLNLFITETPFQYP